MYVRVDTHETKSDTFSRSIENGLIMIYMGITGGWCDAVQGCLSGKSVWCDAQYATVEYREREREGEGKGEGEKEKEGEEVRENYKQDRIRNEGIAENGWTELGHVNSRSFDLLLSLLTHSPLGSWIVKRNMPSSRGSLVSTVQCSVV